MRLDDWLRKHEMRAADFADRIRMTEASVSRLRRGRQRPTLETIERIRTATSGDVDAIDFIERAEERAQ